MGRYLINKLKCQVSLRCRGRPWMPGPARLAECQLIGFRPDLVTNVGGGRVRPEMFHDVLFRRKCHILLPDNCLSCLKSPISGQSFRLLEAPGP